MLTHEDKPVVVQLGNWISIKEQTFHVRREVCFRSTVGPVCDSFAGPMRYRWRVRESVHASRGGSSLDSLCSIRCFFWELWLPLSRAQSKRSSPVGSSWGFRRRCWWLFSRPPVACEEWACMCGWCTGLPTRRLLLAAVALHHVEGHGDFASFLGQVPWPAGRVDLTPAMTPARVLVVGLLIVWAAAGKSALVPFSGWLPRAMEGPTPSSAVFYGALSVHLGAYLLLRFSPSTRCVARAGAHRGGAWPNFRSIRQLHGQGAVRYQVRCRLHHLTQVGIIVAEIGLASVVIALARWSAGGALCRPGQLQPVWESVGYGIRYWALLHLLGHGCWRTLQLGTRSHDFVRLSCLGRRRLAAISLDACWSWDGSRHEQWESWRGTALRWSGASWTTRLKRLFVEPLLALLQSCDRIRKRATKLLSQPEEEEARRPRSTMLEDLV